MKVVIIGGVAGGAGAAARIRRLDDDAEIVMLERGGYISFANCGLPYHVGDVIVDREELLLQDPQKMKNARNIDVRVHSEVTAIDPDKKVVKVNGPDGEYEEPYDELVIATGSSPVRPPIPGIDGSGIQVLWNVDDVDRIKAMVDVQKPERAVVVGGGFIGLEMAENLNARGIKVSLVEALDQVMAPFDPDMAEVLHHNIRENGVELCLGDGVSSFEEGGGVTTVTLASGKKIDAEMVVLAIGVRPNSELAKDAGIETNARGGIVADDMMRTSAPHIWAVGDVIEVDHFITREKTMIPLAGPANKQGRIVADNIMGGEVKYRGSMGTSVAQVFDMTAASVGLNEKALKAKGLEKGKDYHAFVITQKSHAGYYPGATPIFIKLVFDADGKVLGAQAAGENGVDKRIDTIAVTIAFGGSVEDLANLELAYAPPYSSAKDPVNMAGFVAENLLEGRVEFVSPFDLEGKLVLDVRRDDEIEEYAVPEATWIPLGQLRKRYEELPKDKEIAVMCAVGVRAYNAALFLKHKGFENVKVIEGGINFYKATR